MSLYFGTFLEFILFLLDSEDLNFEGNNVHRGLTIQQMQEIQIIDRSLIQDNERCSICMESFMEQRSLVLRQLECGHHYHENCLFEWLELHSTCPLCRYALINNFQGPPSWNPGSENANRHGEYGVNYQNNTNSNAQSMPNISANTQNIHLQGNLNGPLDVGRVVRRNPRRSVRRDIDYSETRRYHHN